MIKKVCLDRFLRTENEMNTHLSVIFECFGVVFYLQTCKLLKNVLLDSLNILTITITLFINQSMCAKRKISI